MRLVEIPLTLLLQLNINNDWFDVWSAYPFTSPEQIHNRFFLSNNSFEYAQQMIPTIKDLNGLTVIGAFIFYPPYTAYYHVVSINLKLHFIAEVYIFIELLIASRYRKRKSFQFECLT